MNKKKTLSYAIFVISSFVLLRYAFKFTHSEITRSQEVSHNQQQTNREDSEARSARIFHQYQPINSENLSTLNNVIQSSDLQTNTSHQPATFNNSSLDSAASNLYGPFQNTNRLIQALVESLTSKLAVSDPKVVVKNIENKCQAMRIEYNDSCNDTERICPQKVLPENLKARIEQLVLRDSLQISEEYRNAIRNMTDEISGYYDIIIVGGLSSNHYREAQSLMKHVHEELFPVLKNFSFVVYNLGLTEEEASKVRQHCRCQFVRFPFERFPPHFKTLKCFGFKPTLVRALIEKANIVLWTDTVFKISRNITTVIDRARTMGIQQMYLPTNYPNPSHTLEQTFHFFGDSPCAHMAFNQVAGGFGIYHNELLTKRAILDPWYACALKAECTCPVDQRKVQRCPYPYSTKKIGLCQRNDQSSMTLILSKLFREKYFDFVINLNRFNPKSKIPAFYNYFEEIENKTKVNIN
uniref:Uncharacterized protein n=1 Tax=Biomphalaria glabrata TaxID=6526 RepID=A0A2C9KH96_BIOGL